MEITWTRANEQGCARFTTTMELVGKRWTPGILLALMRGASRFSEIRSAVSGLSDRLLAQRLRELEGHDLVVREVVATMPVGVRYTLSDRGRELMEALQPLLSYGRQTETAPSFDPP